MPSARVIIWNRAVVGPDPADVVCGEVMIRIPLLGVGVNITYRLPVFNIEVEGTGDI